MLILFTEHILWHGEKSQAVTKKKHYVYLLSQLSLQMLMEGVLGEVQATRSGNWNTPYRVHSLLTSLFLREFMSVLLKLR